MKSLSSYSLRAYAWKISTLTLILLASSFLQSASELPAQESSQRLTGKRWIDMDYGPYLSASLQVEKGNIAYKGIAIRLDEGDGGVSRGSEFMLFDTDTMRYAAGWTGSEFISWRSIVYDGSHGTHPEIRGQTIFSNPVGPGWAKPGSEDFTDARIRGHDNLPYGPLDRRWAHWKGLYLHGNKVILSYTVGETDVLEMPGSETQGDKSIFARTLQIGPRSEELILQIAKKEGAKVHLTPISDRKSADSTIAILAEAQSGSGQSLTTAESLKFDGGMHLVVQNSEKINLTSTDYSIVARVKTTEGGTIISQAPKDGPWASNGKTLFIRDGRLVFDMGWVGEISSRRRINDGRWHDVAMTFAHQTGLVKLFVDGRPQRERRLKPKDSVEDFVLKIGYTSADFPREQSGFRGEISDLQIFKKELSLEQLKSLSNDSLSAYLIAKWSLKPQNGEEYSDLSKHGFTARSVRTGKVVSVASGISAFACLGTPHGTKWRTTDEGDVRLVLPAGDEVIRMKILASQVPRKKPDSPKPLGASFVAYVHKSSPPIDLKPLTRGGPKRWNREVTTEVGTLGDQDGAYATDVLTAPMQNPWRSWMRLGGFDFFPDGRQAAVCTWMGDVWVVEGLTEKPSRLSWRRIATGMFQPLGVKIVDEKIYVTCRDQISVLHDLNNDGEIDFYQNFNNDHQVTEHFHEFAMDLQTDDKGNFYYAKSARHAKDSLVPHHGTLIKVSSDGKTSEIVCYGFRAANGVGIGPNGELATSDQEGHWTPANRINLVKSGGFYGNMYSYHRGQRPTDYLPPLCWLPTKVDRSPAEQLWVESDRWGPLTGKMLSLSYGTGKAWHVMYESVSGNTQGGVVRLPLPDFPTGVMRGRFSPSDGQLYLCGLFGWSSNKTQSGGLYRVRYTGKKLYLPLALNVKKEGIEITFSEPLDKVAAIDIDNYNIEQWNYRWTGNYGSKHYSVLNPKRQGQDEVEIYDATISEDGKTVYLELEDLQEVMQMQISFTLTAADGTEIRQDIWNTINAVP